MTYVLQNWYLPIYLSDVYKLGRVVNYVCRMALIAKNLHLNYWKMMCTVLETRMCYKANALIHSARIVVNEITSLLQKKQDGIFIKALSFSQIMLSYYSY